MTVSRLYQEIYEVVRHIPPGKVSSYGRIAEMCGHPGAARQVGYAMAALRSDDPAYADVPWQRVVGGSGAISVRASGGGQARQAAALRDEGVEVSPDFKIDLDAYLWEGLLPHEVDKLFAERLA